MSSAPKSVPTHSMAAWASFGAALFAAIAAWQSYEIANVEQQRAYDRIQFVFQKSEDNLVICQVSGAIQYLERVKITPTLRNKKTGNHRIATTFEKTVSADIVVPEQGQPCLTRDVLMGINAEVCHNCEPDVYLYMIEISYEVGGDTRTRSLRWAD